MLNKKANNTKLIMETWRRFINEGTLEVIGDTHMPELSDDPESFRCFKKPIPLNFRIAQGPEEVQTKEGPVDAEAGAYIMTGTKGENWPIPADQFNYDILTQDGNTGTAAKKKIIVHAKEMSAPFEVKVSWSDSTLKGNAGDYLVQYGTGDYGVVGREIFNETYESA